MFSLSLSTAPSQVSSSSKLELCTASSICNVIYLNAVLRVYVSIDLDRFQDPDIGLIAFDQNFMHNILLIDGVKDIGHRLGSELCGTDEQHRII